MKTIVNELAKTIAVLVCSIIQIVSLVFSSIAWVFTKASDILGIAIEKLTEFTKRKLGRYES